MIQSTEKRVRNREFQKGPVLVQELNDIFMYSARMVNYSDKGVYIETDTAIKVGTDIIIGIGDSTFISHSASPDSPKYYHARIMWQKELVGDFFKFGYGTKFIHIDERQNATETNSKLETENRKHPRKRYSKLVIFTSMNQNYKGLIRNISHGGAFIEARGKFKTGQIIKLIIPGTKIDNGRMLKGEVLHFNQGGVGIIFKGLIKKQPQIKSSRN